MKTAFVALYVTYAMVMSPAAGQLPRPYVVDDPPRLPHEQQKLFHLPPGFRIELVAAEPEIVNPINLNFDAAGRLLVSQSIEYPIPDDLTQPGRDTIVCISDTNGDSIPDTTAIFADGLHIPIGVTPVPGGALGFSIPQIYFFADNNADGVADDRTAQFGEFGFEDTHGMISSLTHWIDGWVYGCHGFVNTSEVAGVDGKQITMTSGNTYRLLPDGTRIEHYAYGQVNPFGLAIDPWGNVFTSDCHTRPATMLLRGAHYPRSLGDGLGFGPELMTHSHGSTGIAGIVSYWADQFPQEFRGSLFIGNPITGCINCDRLELHGSTFTAIEQPDFLTCDDFWFRPVDIQLGPDGALYIADMCNCIIGHYEVSLTHEKRDRLHGPIWRVSYVGDEKSPSAISTQAPVSDLTTANVASLVELLGHDNLVIRTQATHQLVERATADAVKAVRRILTGDSSDTQRAHGLWVLHRVGEFEPTDWQPLMNDAAPLVRLHNVKALAEFAEWNDDHRNAVLARMSDDDAFVRRAAADALGRHPHDTSVPALLRLLTAADEADVNLVHTARMSLRDTLVSIDCFPKLEATYADDEDALARLADVTVAIPSAAAATFLGHRFARGEYPTHRVADILRHIVRYSDESDLPEINQIAKTYADHDNQTQLAVSSALVQGSQERGIPVPEAIHEWAERLIRPLLTSADVAEVHRGIELVTQMRLASLGPEMVALSRFDSLHPTERVAAMQGLMATGSPAVKEMLVAVIEDSRENAGLRQIAAEKYANRKDVRDDVLKRLSTAPHLVVVGLARGLLVDREGIVDLLDSVEQGRVTGRILRDGTIERLLPLIGQPEDAARFEALTENMPSLDERIQQSINQQRLSFAEAEPDVTRGEAVFRKTCALCHRLDNDGARVGPELDGIGQRGIDRLLEDVLDPNRTVDKSFQATILVTVDGQVLTGLVTGQEGEILLLTDQAGKQQRISLADIEQRRLIATSAMPANVTELLQPDELNDLLAFLLTRTAKSTMPGAQAGE